MPSSSRRRSSRVTPGGLREEQHRVALAAELDALIDARQKAAAPQGAARAGDLAGDHHDVGRQVAVLAAQAVADPRADARPAEPAEAGVKHELGRAVVDLLGVQRLHDGDVVGHGRQVRQQFSDSSRPLLAVLGELELRAQERRMPAEEREPLALRAAAWGRAGRRTFAASACSRTGRAATARRPCAGR